MLRFSLSKLKQSQQAPWLVIDMLMLVLVIINLLWLLFDSLYATQIVKDALHWLWPPLVSSYAPIHANFLLIDFIFVGIFLSEFCLRWVVSVWQKEYLRWYFFPFIHWYDLLGCLPASSARIFRLLRIFSILYRLHRYQIIDFKNTAAYRFVLFYRNVLLEELSDRIVIKVLSDIQREVRSGSPLLHQLVDNLILSRQQVVLNWLASTLQHLGHSMQDAEQSQQVKDYIQQAIAQAVHSNKQVATLNWFPLLGNGLEKQLQQAVSDIVYHSIVNLLQDLEPEKLSELSKLGAVGLHSQQHNLDEQMRELLADSLEIIKTYVAKQNWKQQLT